MSLPWVVFGETGSLPGDDEPWINKDSALQVNDGPDLQDCEHQTHMR